MDTLQRIESARADLHEIAKSLAFSHYLRRGYAPPDLKHIIDVTSSLENLGKYNPNWQNQPRVPSGQTGGGQWTSGGSETGTNKPKEPKRPKPERPSVEDIHDPPLESVYPVEALVGGLGALSVRGALAAIRIATGASSALYSSLKVRKAAKAIEEYFGGRPSTDTNDSGDIFMIRGNKKIRFDLKNPHGQSPHFHIQRRTPRGRWRDAGKEHRHTFKDK